MNLRTLTVAVLLVFSTPVLLASDYFYKVPNSPPEYKNRLKIKATGGFLEGELYFDDRPYTYFVLQETSGNPLIFWVTKDKIILKTSERTAPGDGKWRLFDLRTKKISEIGLEGFNSNLRPTINGSRMGYQASFSDGRLGCIVYDWESETYKARWVSKSKSLKGIAIGFIENSAKVSCTVILGWTRKEDLVGGQGVYEEAELGKRITINLD